MNFIIFSHSETYFFISLIFISSLIERNNLLVVQVCTSNFIII